MTLTAILDRVTEFVGRFTGTSPNATKFFLKEVADFIIDHKLILFFVLLSFIYVGVTLIRRLIRS